MLIGVMWWQILVLAAVVIVVLGFAGWGIFRLGLFHGLVQENEHVEAKQSIFGDTVDTAQAERGLIQIMYGGVIVLRRNRVVEYASPVVEELQLVQDNMLISDELIDMLNQSAADGVLREREIECDRNAYVGPSVGAGNHNVQPAHAVSGIGVQPGTVLASKKVNLRVRVGLVAGEIYAILIQDMSEQRSFERMRRDFVTNVSHELKTPAGAIALLAETVSDAADDPDAVRYFSGRISKESQRLTGLVGRLIELQKAEETLDIEQDKPSDVVETVADAIRENLVQAEAKQIEIVLSCDGQRMAFAEDTNNSQREGTGINASAHPLLIQANANALKTAVKNLVENAVRYSPVKTHVAVGIVSDEQAIHIKVVDQGIGIPERSLSRVFERFYRVDPARSRETGGTGLGLSITKHCVQECGGTIAVWSREGEGSTFTITLPRSAGSNLISSTEELDETQA